MMQRSITTTYAMGNTFFPTTMIISIHHSTIFSACTSSKSKMIYINIIFFFFNDTAPTEISPLSLPDALPISRLGHREQAKRRRQAVGLGPGQARGPVQVKITATAARPETRNCRGRKCELRRQFSIPAAARRNAGTRAFPRLGGHAPGIAGRLAAEPAQRREPCAGFALSHHHLVGRRLPPDLQRWLYPLPGNQQAPPGAGPGRRALLERDLERYRPHAGRRDAYRRGPLVHRRPLLLRPRPAAGRSLRDLHLRPHPGR